MLAFDGGSTKTDVVLVSRTGAVLGRARVGPSNHQLIGVEGAHRCADAGGDRRRGGRGPVGRRGPAHLPDGGVLPRRDRPARRRGAARRRDRRKGMDGARHRAQRHVRRLTHRHDVPVGYRRRVRDGNELRRRRPRREDGPLPRAGRALRGLRAGRRVAGGACPRTGAACRRRQGAGHRRCANGCRPIWASPMRRRCSPASTPAPSPTRASSNWHACSSTPRRTATRWPARRPTPWPTRSWPSSAPPSSGSTCRTRSSRWCSAAACSTPAIPPSSTGSPTGVHAAAPRAVLVRLDAPPVLGAALIGLDAIGAPPHALAALREALAADADAADASAAAAPTAAAGSNSGP